jgi:hypothetical protein
MPSELPSRRLKMGPKTVSSRSIMVSFLIPYINALPPRKIVPQNKKILHFSPFVTGLFSGIHNIISYITLYIPFMLSLIKVSWVGNI